MKSNRGQISHHTCVGGFIPLKGKIDDADYNCLEGGLKGSCPPEKELIYTMGDDKVYLPASWSRIWR